MTQYGIGLTFCDIELELLQKAIAHYSKLCNRELKKGRHAPFRGHSITIKWIQAKLGKATKGSLEVSLCELEQLTLEAALKSYVDAVEREIATDVNKPFRADVELVKTICEAMHVEYWRAALSDELKQERRSSIGDLRLKNASNTNQLSRRSAGHQAMYIIPMDGRIFAFGLTRKAASLDFARRQIHYDGPKLKIYRCSPELYRRLVAEGGSATPSALRFRINAKGVAVPDAS